MWSDRCWVTKKVVAWSVAEEHDGYTVLHLFLLITIGRTHTTLLVNFVIIFWSLQVECVVWDEVKLMSRKMC